MSPELLTTRPSANACAEILSLLIAGLDLPRHESAALLSFAPRKYYFSRNCLTRQGRINVTLTPAAQKFVLHWGEMGQAWGINRTMAQVHALLFVAPTPLDAEEISTLLDVSRSNVSTSLRELITWGVVRRVHIIGDRRDRFEALKDVMETFRVIMAERKRREMDPTIALLEHCVHEAKAGRSGRAIHARAVGKDARVHQDGHELVQPYRQPLDLRLSCAFSAAERCSPRCSAGANTQIEDHQRPGKGRGRSAARSLDSCAARRPHRVIAFDHSCDRRSSRRLSTLMVVHLRHLFRTAFGARRWRSLLGFRSDGARTEGAGRRLVASLFVSLGRTMPAAAAAFFALAFALAASLGRVSQGPRRRP